LALNKLLNVIQIFNSADPCAGVNAIEPVVRIASAPVFVWKIIKTTVCNKHISGSRGAKIIEIG